MANHLRTCSWGPQGRTATPDHPLTRRCCSAACMATAASGLLDAWEEEVVRKGRGTARTPSRRRSTPRSFVRTAPTARLFADLRLEARLHELTQEELEKLAEELGYTRRREQLFKLTHEQLVTRTAELARSSAEMRRKADEALVKLRPLSAWLHDRRHRVSFCNPPSTLPVTSLSPRMQADSLAASRIFVHVDSMFAGAGLSQHQWPSSKLSRMHRRWALPSTQILPRRMCVRRAIMDLNLESRAGRWDLHSARNMPSIAG